MIYIKRLIIVTLIITSCTSLGLLTFISDLPNNLKEVSAVELDLKSKLFWVIEDSGNKNNLIGLNSDGDVIRTVNISNSYNEDWEDLTSDSMGNIYIGDFGNNDENRTLFKIYKVNNSDLNKKEATASIIEFTLPTTQDSKDLEAFFLYNNHFYVFSKEHKEFVVLKIPNTIGTHEALVHAHHNFNGKNNRITSADISNDGTSIALLNHNKLWKISNFKNDDFFSGQIEPRPFKHDSQKEGLCFKNDSTVIITDERKGAHGGNIYGFNLN